MTDADWGVPVLRQESAGVAGVGGPGRGAPRVGLYWAARCRDLHLHARGNPLLPPAYLCTTLLQPFAHQGAALQSMRNPARHPKLFVEISALQQILTMLRSKSREFFARAQCGGASCQSGRFRRPVDAVQLRMRGGSELRVSCLPLLPSGGQHNVWLLQETGFFRGMGGSWDSPYGDFFMSWYSGALLAHGERLIKIATSVFHTLHPRRCTITNHNNSAQSIVNVGPAYGSPGGLQVPLAFLTFPGQICRSA